VTNLTRKVERRVPPKRRGDDNHGGLFKRVVCAVTRPDSTVRTRTANLLDWDPLNWLRAWEFHPLLNTEAALDEPVRSALITQEGIFLASTLTGFML
jgi:hypothetical protein